MKYNSLLESLDKRVGKNLETRRYTLPEMISESYRSLYECNSGTNLQKLVESHINDVRNNPTDIERLSRQLSIVKEVIRLTESGDINDEDLDIATKSKLEGDVEKEVEADREERQEATEEKVDESAQTEDEEDLLEDTELTDEEVEELAKHLAEIRKNKKVNETEDKAEESEESLEEEASPSNFKVYQLCMDVAFPADKEPRYYGLDFGSRNRELIRAITDTLHAHGLEMAGDMITAEHDMTQYYIDNEYDFFDESKEEKSEEDNKTYESLDLSEFKKKSNKKSFVQTFKKLAPKLHEGTALTRQESISLYKAANSAMTHLSVELEHNPEFLQTFKESVTLLSADVGKLLGSLKEGKAPSKANMKSLAKFSEALLKDESIDEGIFDSKKKQKAQQQEFDEEIETNFKQETYDVVSKTVQMAQRILSDMSNSREAKDETRSRNYIKTLTSAYKAAKGKKSNSQTLLSAIQDLGNDYAPSSSGNKYLEDFFDKYSALRSDIRNYLMELINKDLTQEVEETLEYYREKYGIEESASTEKIQEEESGEELPPIEDEEEEIFSDEEEVDTTESEESEEFDQEYADARVELHKEIAEEHADDEDPAVQEKIAQDAEEVLNLPGISEEQAEEIMSEELPVSEETPDETEIETPEEEIEDSKEVDSEEDIEETEDLKIDDEEITDEELAELKKHLKEMRETKRIEESKARKLVKRS